MNTPKITVYGFVPYDRSGKVTWTLSELGLEFDFIALDHKKDEHRTPEHLARHPMGAVPVLQIDDLILHESDAILWFLAERFPKGNLIPELGTPERATCLQWFHFCAATLGSANSSRWPLKNLPNFTDDAKALDGKPAKDFLVSLKKDIEADFQLSLKVLENRLTGRQFLCERFTIADISIAYSLSWMESKGDLGSYPVLTEYLRQIRSRTAAIKSKVFDK